MNIGEFMCQIRQVIFQAGHMLNFTTLYISFTGLVKILVGHVKMFAGHVTFFNHMPGDETKC